MGVWGWAVPDFLTIFLMLAVLGGTGFLIQSGFLRHARDDQTHKTSHQVIPSLARPNPPKPLRLLARSAETPSLQDTSGECGAAEGRGRGRCTHCVSMAQMPMAQMPEHAHTDCLRHHVFVWVRFLIFGGGWCGQISDSGPFLIGIFLFGHGERRRRYRIS